MKPTGMIDLHCDTLTVPYEGPRSLTDANTNITLGKMPRGCRWAQLFAIFILDNLRGQAAKDYFEEYYRYFEREMALHSDLVTPCRTFGEVEAAFAAGKFAAILAVEGGAVLAGEPERVAYLAQKGVKALTLTWNGPNEVCSGHADESQGFTEFGRWVVPELERQGILVDTSHLNDKGFEELMGMVKRPFIASHSNSRAICSHPRNLPDAHFKEFVRCKGLVGLNYCINFIRDDANVKSFDDLYRHIEHFLELGGEDVIALGSDFDGAPLPPFLNSVENSLELYDYLRGRGLTHEQADKILFKNAYEFFRRNL